MMLVYSPANVDSISMQNAIQGNSPSLSDIDVAFGKGSALTWLVMWITEVYATCGFIGEVSEKMRINAAKIILSEYSNLRIEEVVVFFQRFMAGKYKSFYKKPNLQVITSSIFSFLQERECAFAEKNEESKDKAVPFEEWKKKFEDEGFETILGDVKTNGSEAVYLLSPKYKTANMIFHNTMNADFQTLNKYRDKFIEVYKEDPYEYMIKLNKK